MATTRVELVSPQGTLFSGRAEMLACRTEGGDIAFLADHMAYVGVVVPGDLRIVGPEGAAPGAELRFLVEGGFVEVNANRVVVACEGARGPL